MGDFLKYKINIISLAGFKGAQIVSTLIITQILITEFGKVDYAVFVVILSIGQMVMIDAGAGEAVKKSILSGVFDDKLLVFNGVVIAGCSSIIISLFFYIFISIFNTEYISETTLEIITVFLISTLIMPLRLSREVFTAYHETYKHSLILAVCIIVSICYAIVFSIDTFVEAILIQHGTLLVGNALAMLYLIIDKNISFRCHKFDIGTIKMLLPNTMKFLLLGLSLMLINGVDIVLLSYLGLENDSLTEFSLVLRIFIYIHTFFMFVIYPSWPLLSKLLESNYSEYLLMRRKLSFTIIGGGLVVVLLVAIFIPDLILMWVGVDIGISLLTIYSLAAFTYFRLVSEYFDYLLRSEGGINSQMYCTFIEAILHVLLGVCGWFINGLAGFTFGVVIATLFARIIPFSIMLFTNRKFANDAQ